MLIALDYDGTYTADPELWLMFVLNAQQRGHSVICATMRTPQEGKDMCPILVNTIEIIYTSRQAKLIYLEKLGIFPDIWIDDSPDFLFHNAS